MPKFILYKLETHVMMDGNLHVLAEDCGDQYHTMHELYQHRMALTIALFHAWHASRLYTNYKVSKSKMHHDGTMFEGGYFVVVAETSKGQISYHYKLKHWDEFKIPEVERAPEWDGHSSLQTLERLSQL